MFIHFIRSEEEEYRLENINYDNSIEIKIDNEVKKELNLNDINEKKRTYTLIIIIPAENG